MGDASAWHVIGLASETRTNVLCASPPCQPYSSAGKGRGLFAQEAWPFVEWIWSLRVLQLPLALLENVGGLICHRRWSILSALIHQSGYDINITQLSPLSKCQPTHRTRFLAVLVNRRLGITHQVTPPLLPSLPLDTTLLRSVIGYPWPESHLAELQLTDEQVCFYDRQDLLPVEWSGCGEYVIEARIMHTSEHARTALASYGRAHDFGESCLADGKLLGRLLRAFDLSVHLNISFCMALSVKHSCCGIFGELNNPLGTTSWLFRLLRSLSLRFSWSECSIMMIHLTSCPRCVQPLFIPK